jgi:hypothetical protein
MGINAKQKEDKQAEKSAKELQKKQENLRKLDRELKSCMRCKYFYGNNSQCIKKKCFKEKKVQREKAKKKTICDDCVYRHGEGYCFPCYKEIVKGGYRNG